MANNRNISGLKTLIRQTIVETLDQSSLKDVIGNSYGGESNPRDPREKLLRKILAYSEIKQRFGNKTPHEIAAEMGFVEGRDDEVIEVLKDLLTNQLYK